MTEQELSDLLSRSHCRVAGDPLQKTIQAHGFKGGKAPEKPKRGKFQGESLTLILPFKLPTWNQLLAMDQWQRAKCRNLIKKHVSECIRNGEDLPTQTGSARRLSLTPLSLAEYSQTITPNSSKKSRTRKKRAPLTKLS